MDTKKKICFVIPSLGYGGMENMVIYITNALAERGYDVTIINVTFHNDDMKSKLSAKVRYLDNQSHKVSMRHFSIKLFLKGRIRLLPFEKYLKVSSPKRLYKEYIHDVYDVEIAFFRGTAVKIVSGSNNTSSKKIAWVHNDFAHCEGIDYSFINMNAARKGYSKFDQIISVSESARRSFINFIGEQNWKENTSTIYNLLPIEKIKQSAKEIINEGYEFSNGFTIVAVGRLVHAKGFDRLIEVAKKLEDEMICVNIWIIGEGNERATLESMIQQKGINTVHLLGYQENPYKFVSKADLLVCSSRYEGYNLTVAEAIILGIPAVSTYCTGPVEILDNGEYGLIVENSEEGLYSGIKKLAIDKNLYNYYKTKVQERINFFNEETIIEQIEKVINGKA